MLCRQCQQLRQKYLKHTWWGRRRRDALPASATARGCCGSCLPALLEREQGFLVASLWLEDMVLGNIFTPNSGLINCGKPTKCPTQANVLRSYCEQRGRQLPALPPTPGAALQVPCPSHLLQSCIIWLLIWENIQRQQLHVLMLGNMPSSSH